MKLSKILYGLSLSVFVSFPCVAGDAANNGVTGVEALSPELRGLIKSEMIFLDKGFKSLFTAYYSGDAAAVVAIAKDIQASFVLKKSLTPVQKKELHRVLPEDFLARDKQFHYFAGMLSHTAEKGKDELVGFYFSKLADACVQCHEQHASHRFNFTPHTEEKEHHH